MLSTQWKLWQTVQWVLSRNVKCETHKWLKLSMWLKFPYFYTSGIFMKTENFQVLNYAYSLYSWIQPATFLTRNIRWGVLRRWWSWSWATFNLNCCWLICQWSGGTTVWILPSTFRLACFSGFLVLSSEKKNCSE